MNVLRLAFSPRYLTLTLSVLGVGGFAFMAGQSEIFGDLFALIAVVCFALAALGAHDLVQTRHAVLRNYPIAAHLRFLLEDMRPAIRQYFFEGDKSGAPFSRDMRAIAYQRSKRELDKRPFGTEIDVYEEGYEFVRHSVAPSLTHDSDPRIVIGPDCAKPYAASLYNISAMSFGALSANAIRALNAGARRGGFAHDTGEGGVSPYHLENGGDLIWEIGSGYFGCRDETGAFSVDAFAAVASAPQIRMIEVKLSRAPSPAMAACCRPPNSRRKSRPSAKCRLGSIASRPRVIRRSRRRSSFCASLRVCANCPAANRPASNFASAIRGNFWRSARRWWRPA